IDKLMSRQHTRLELVQDDLTVRDLNSSNGTFINGERVEQAMLKKGDIITVGSYDISWEYLHPESVNATVFQAMPPDHTVVRKTPEPEPQSEAITPAQKVVEAATAYNREHGHENDGFLSTEYGFMPVEPPLLELPSSHRVWDDMIDELPDLFRT